MQLDPKKVILVCSHNQNTFDKRTLLVNPNPSVVKETTLKVTDFITNSKLIHFFTFKMHNDLAIYKPGDPEMKPDVIEYMEKKKVERAFSIKYNGKIMYGDEILGQLNNQQSYINLLQEKIKRLEKSEKSERFIM